MEPQQEVTAQKRKLHMDYAYDQSTESAVLPPAKKRCQSQGFFRPWLDSETPVKNSVAAAPVSQYHANMVRCHTPRQRSPKEQLRRDRNRLACLLSRRAKQAQEARLEQQYMQYQAQHAANLEQQLRLSLYYRQLLQQAVYQRGIGAPSFALPQQQQQFLQQMSLSQQLLIFGTGAQQ